MKDSKSVVHIENYILRFTQTLIFKGETGVEPSIVTFMWCEDHQEKDLKTFRDIPVAASEHV